MQRFDGGRKARRRFALVLVATASWLATGADAARFEGRVVDRDGAPVAGAMLTFERGEPAHRISVFADDAGRYRSPELPPEPHIVRARRIGWRDATREASPGALSIELERLTDAAAVAAQLPAHHWYARVIEQLDDPEERHLVKRECTYCHQQGSLFTRRERSEDDWRKVIAMMARRGAMLPAALRERLPALFIQAYAPEAAVPALTAGFEDPDFVPPPGARVRAARIDEWDLGSRASMQHDVVLHPSGALYSVDMGQDQLFRLDPETGAREAWSIPPAGRTIGGIFGSEERPLGSASNARVGPHSLQVAPDGRVWITLATGNMLAGFDPQTEAFEVHEVAAGFYPHTLRFDSRGRFWYTMAASNHVGMFDPATGEQRHVRLPARTLQQELVLRLMPVFMWLDQRIGLRERASEGGDGFTMPVPYGIDVAADDGVWISQLNEDRLGRIDPDTLAYEIVELPFRAPRRFRIDADGLLWIPSFSGGALAAYDPATGTTRQWSLPIEPVSGETPYALHVDRVRGVVWICGTNSDTLIRFDPREERFDVFPMPTQVTYTREVDFDALGRVWTSNSNSPAWQIEGGQPRVIRLDPGDLGDDARAQHSGPSSQ